MDFISKLFPIGLVTAGTYMGLNHLTPMVDKVKLSMVQVEMKGIARLLSYEEELKDVPTPSQFSEYLRKNISSQDEKRDMSKDLWGNLYQLSWVNGTLFVTSTGPDGLANTTDDIRVKVNPILY